MRQRIFRYSIGVIFCLSSLIAAAPGCDRMDNGPAEPLEAESSALEQAASLAGAAGRAAPLAPGSELDRQQLAALFDNAVPVEVGAPCPDVPLNDVCHAPSYTPVTDCAGFTDICDSSGSQTVHPVIFLCKAIPGGTECKGFVQETSEARECFVPTDGRSCSPGCGASFCSPYSSQCDRDTTRVRNCVLNGVCASNTCANQIFTQEIVGTCERDTEGQHCSPIGGCKFPKVGLCNVNGNCACLSGQQ